MGENEKKNQNSKGTPTRLKEYSPLLSLGRNVKIFKQLASRTYLPKAVSGSNLTGENGQSYMLICEVFLMTNNGRIKREIKFTINGFEGGSLMFFQTLKFFQPKSNLTLGCRVYVKCWGVPSNNKQFREKTDSSW